MCDKACCRRHGACISIIVIVVCVCLLIPIFVPWPEPQKIAIVNANLIRFELATSPTTSLFFDLRFTMRIHNSIWYGHAYYHDIEIASYYNTKKFDLVELGNFGLAEVKTRIVNHSISGNATVNLTSNEVDAFKRSNETGYFDIEIWLRGKRFSQDCDYGNQNMDYYYGDQITNYDCGDFFWPDLSYQCKLRLQLITSQNSTTQGNFKPVKCH
ncbi:hypothetical protein LUZ61_015991 [Rhynchospora tenuis]|uniref:Protein YLS9-like n=1 Tax=Rhynchospora tenuis TaxID=198213 RepID=A0AAD5Z4N2_9POAL|nr:hypothetical protein LUZ61_015991 [Rhynchospora tenuis]